jgi:hypothetical protein
MNYYVLTGEECTGPFPLEQLPGQIKPESLLKREGEHDWQPQQHFPEVQTLLASSQAEAATQAKPVSIAGKLPKPWDPQTIVFGGILFTPIWAGVMAAMNERRLGSQRTPAPAIWIAAIWFVADFVLYPLLGWGLLATWLTTAACLWLLWEIVLVEQRKDFAKIPVEQNFDHYGLPVLAGVPAMLMLGFQFFSAATSTPTPYELCQRFEQAKPADRLPLSSSKMQELLSAIEKFKRDGGTMTWGLTKDPEAVYTLQDDITLVAIDVSITNDFKNGPLKFPAYIQLVNDPKQGLLVDDFVVSIQGQMTLNSMHANRANIFTYRSSPQNISITRSPIPNNKTDLRPYVVPAAIAAKTALPLIGKLLAMLGIGALALGKGFFSTASKRQEST